MTAPSPNLVPLPDGALPIRALLDETIGDTSSDYADGDHPGYYRWSWSDETQILTVTHEPDPAGGTTETTAHFALVHVEAVSV